jgi:predicted O-methyltransferase YrrM
VSEGASIDAGSRVHPAQTFADAFARTTGVQGWMSEAQAKRLWDAASRVPPRGLVVEIGSFHGRSAIVVASALAESARLVAIDPHAGGDRGPQEIEAEAERGGEDYVAFHENVRAAGVESRIEHVRLMSSDAYDSVDDAIDVLYVDGAHRFGPAREDIVEWGNRVRDGGTMLVHDSFASVGVTLATLASLTFGSRWRYLGRTSSLAEYRREALSPGARGVNALRQLAQLPWFLRNVNVKIGIVTGFKPLARLMGHRGDDWPY